jgi:hypothetical protein
VNRPSCMYCHKRLMLSFENKPGFVCLKCGVFFRDAKVAWVYVKRVWIDVPEGILVVPEGEEL